MGVYSGYIIKGCIGPNIGIMGKKMETTIMGYIGIVGYILRL